MEEEEGAGEGGGAGEVWRVCPRWRLVEAVVVIDEGGARNQFRTFLCPSNSKLRVRPPCVPGMALPSSTLASTALPSTLQTGALIEWLQTQVDESEAAPDTSSLTMACGAAPPLRLKAELEQLSRRARPHGHGRPCGLRRWLRRHGRRAAVARPRLWHRVVGDLETAYGRAQVLARAWLAAGLGLRGDGRRGGMPDLASDDARPRRRLRAFAGRHAGRAHLLGDLRCARARAGRSLRCSTSCRRTRRTRTSWARCRPSAPWCAILLARLATARRRQMGRSPSRRCGRWTTTRGRIRTCTTRSGWASSPASSPTSQAGLSLLPGAQPRLGVEPGLPRPPHLARWALRRPLYTLLVDDDAARPRRRGPRRVHAAHRDVALYLYEVLPRVAAFLSAVQDVSAIRVPALSDRIPPVDFATSMRQARLLSTMNISRLLRSWAEFREVMVSLGSGSYPKYVGFAETLDAPPASERVPRIAHRYVVDLNARDQPLPGRASRCAASAGTCAT